MVAGALAASGYFAGEDLLRPNRANPKGFFESKTVNRLNHRLIMAMSPPGRWGKFLTAESRRRELDRSWIVDLPVRRIVPLAGRMVAKRMETEMRAVLRREPWCLKDPRFSCTLPAWRPLLKDAVFVVTFRHPARTAESMVRFFAEIHGATVTIDEAVRGWASAYRHVLAHAESGGEWVFVHYDQFVDGSGADRLEQALGCRIDRSFASAELSRSANGDDARGETKDLYAELCRRAAYDAAVVARS